MRCQKTFVRPLITTHDNSLTLCITPKRPTIPPRKLLLLNIVWAPWDFNPQDDDHKILDLSSSRKLTINKNKSQFISYNSIAVDIINVLSPR